MTETLVFKVGMWCFLTVILCASVLFSPGKVQAQTSGAARVVEGSVVNLTLSGANVGGMNVVLHRVDSSGNYDIEVTTDPDGSFRFKAIEYDPRVSYGVSVVYQGGLYGTDLDLSEGSPEPIKLVVYDATSSDSVISVSSASILIASIDKTSQTISALEIVEIANDGDTTYVPGPEPMSLLRFGLPADTRALEVDSRLIGARALQVDRGFALNASVPPGKHSVMFAYNFPYFGDEVEFSRVLRYGAESVRVLAPFGVTRMSSQQLSAVQLVDIGGRPYHLLEGSGIPRGHRLTVVFGALPQSSLADDLRRQLSGIRLEFTAVLALGLLMASLITFALRRGEWRTQNP